jgi:hypothetical protein
LKIEDLQTSTQQSAISIQPANFSEGNRQIPIG